jgi:MobA/MobL family
MANYFLHVKTFARGQGSKVTKAAAYRAGERIRDERTSAVYDHTGRTDVAHAEIVLPSAVAERVDMEWALDRSRLWNAAEHSGRQWNSRLAREVLVHVPPELTPAQRTQLVRSFSTELADRYGNAVDFAVHVPRPQADQRHHHAHLLMTTRQVGPDGLGARTSLDLSGTERRTRGLGASKDELVWIRERWAEVTNEALREAGLAVRVDHRSYRDQGIDREPQPRIPASILYSERMSGRSTPAGDDIRARHRERLEARAQGAEALARVIERQKREGRERAIQSTERKDGAKKIPQGALTREQLNEKRRAYCKANAEEINRKQTERRRANKDEVNRKQREYLRKRTAERKAAKNLAKLREQRPARTKDHAVPLEQGAAMPTPASTPVSAEESVKNWLAFRSERNPAPDQDSLANWLAYRESQANAATAENRLQEPSGDPEITGAGHRGSAPANRDPKRSRKNDLGY